MRLRVKRKGKPKIAVDTETTGLGVWHDDLPFAVGIHFEDGDRQMYWEWDVDPFTRIPKIDPGDLAEIKSILEGDEYEKYFWNLKFDVNMLKKIGVDVGWPMHEGMFMAKSCNNLDYDYRLKPTAKRYAKIGNEDEKDLDDAVKKCRRIAKKLGWNTAEEMEADKWLPRTLCRLEPKLAKEKGLLGEVEDLCKTYCLQDCYRTITLGLLFEHGMSQLGTRKVHDFEMTLMREVTMDMERRGVRTDPDRLQKAMAICRGTMADCMKVIRKAAGRDDIEVNKTEDVIGLLFRGQGPGGLTLPSHSKNKKGEPKVDAEALMPHRHEYPLVDAVLRWRANSKALSTFFEPYTRIAKRERHGMILRTSWNQWGTLTGRFSSQNPSLQCISNPKTTNSKSAEYVVDVRQVFVPRPGCVWYCPDYSQVEVIIFADIAKEPNMMAAIRAGADIHMATTNKVWGGRGNPRAMDAMKKSIMAAEEQKKREGGEYQRYDWASEDLAERAEQLLEEHDWKIGDAEASIGVKIHRKLAKAVTFTKIFGGGWRALMGWINLSASDSKQILRWYDESSPEMVGRMKEIEKTAKKNGYVVNPFGRRLQIDPWYAYRSVNYLVQSAAADLMKRGMLKCARMLKERTGDDARLIMTIHDELIFEFKQGSDDPEIVREICRLMSDHEGAFEVATPVDIEKVTERWSIKEKVEL